MKKSHCCLQTLLLPVLLTLLLAGCGGNNSGGETTPAPAQTGDTSLFPNKNLIASPANVTEAQTIVLDARGSASEYNAGHIPGAIFTPPSLFERDGVLLPADELAKILGDMGLTRTSKIIVYDNTTASRGAAGRLFWILEYLGCTDVTILNGGWDHWIAQDMNWVTEPTTLPAAVFTAEIDPTVVYVTKEYIAEHFLPVPDDGFILIDVRTPEEYLGSQHSTGIPPGHIPNAVNFPYNKCFNSDKTILNFKDLKSLLLSHGIVVDKEMVAYSTTGHRSGFFYFLCRLMGYSNMANYTGSINDWGKANLTDPTAYPISIGSTP